MYITTLGSIHRFFFFCTMSYYNQEQRSFSLTSRSLSVNIWVPPGCAICLSRILSWKCALELTNPTWSCRIFRLVATSVVTSSLASCHIICCFIPATGVSTCWLFWQHCTGTTIQAGAGLIEVWGAEFGGRNRGWSCCCTVCCKWKV